MALDTSEHLMAEEPCVGAEVSAEWAPSGSTPSTSLSWESPPRSRDRSEALDGGPWWCEGGGGGGGGMLCPWSTQLPMRPPKLSVVLFHKGTESKKKWYMESLVSSFCLDPVEPCLFALAQRQVRKLEHVTNKLEEMNYLEEQSWVDRTPNMSPKPSTSRVSLDCNESCKDNVGRNSNPLHVRTRNRPPGVFMPCDPFPTILYTQSGQILYRNKE